MSVFGTVTTFLALEVFLGRVLYEIFPPESGILLNIWICLAAAHGFAYELSLYQERKSNNPPHILLSVTPLKKSGGAGILTSCPSASAFAIALGPTNPWMIAIAKETLGLRRAGLSPALWLLVPTFSLPYAPIPLAGESSLRKECSPTASLLASARSDTRNFGNALSPDKFLAQGL